MNLAKKKKKGGFCCLRALNQIVDHHSDSEVTSLGLVGVLLLRNTSETKARKEQDQHLVNR